MFYGKRRALSCIGLLLALALGACDSEIPAIDPPAKAAFDPATVERGAELALIGNCNTCHTAPGGAPYAGGRAMETPFGVIYATNNSPDPETGIGAWSEDAFRRAMHEGVRRDGAQLYPAFPYDHFTKVSDEDVGAIYAFIMTRQAVRAEIPANDLLFPMNIRPLVAVWKAMFFESGRFQPNPVMSGELNHGAYLVEGLAHCGACHTPRNMLGAERRSLAFSGVETEGWHAPALNAESPAPVPWTEEQLLTYLRRGFVEPHGVAAGPMQTVVDNLGEAPELEVGAIAAYIGAMLEPATMGREPAPPTTTALAEASAPKAAVDGPTLYAGACALCHEPNGQAFSAEGIHLAQSKVITMSDPRNLIEIILYGIDAPENAPHAFMPDFGAALTDAQIATLANFLRMHFGGQPAWSDIDGSLRAARRQGNAS